jgi:hypothetical protein
LPEIIFPKALHLNSRCRGRIDKFNP